MTTNDDSTDLTDLTDRTGRTDRAARREALDLALAAVSGNGHAEQLMLRGSALMKNWYPATAREPGDLDFVVPAQDWEIGDPRTDALFAELARAAEQLSSGAENVRIDAAGAVSEEIWTYDRVPGRRLTLPWRAEGLPGGWVQLDFVFGEKIHVEPERAEIALSPGRPGVPLRVASRELSLAWKVVWLLTDTDVKGKDLYDAVLLAEDTPLSHLVLRDALADVDEQYRARPVRPSDLTDLDVDAGWELFQDEHAWIEGSADKWLLRLRAALEPTFSVLDGRRVTVYELEAAWLAPLTAEIAVLTDDRGAELQQRLQRRGIGLSAAAVITRELVGRERMSVAEAVRAVLETPGRAEQA